MAGCKGRCFACDKKFIIELASESLPHATKLTTEAVSAPETNSAALPEQAVDPSPSQNTLIEKLSSVTNKSNLKFIIAGIILIATGVLCAGGYVASQNRTNSPNKNDILKKRNTTYASDSLFQGLKDGNAELTTNELANWLRKYTDGVDANHIVSVTAPLLDEVEFSRNLAAYELVRQIGYQFFADFKTYPNSTDFLNLLLMNQKKLELLIYGHENGKVSPAVMYTLYCIWKVDPDLFDHSVYSKMAVAFAIQSGGKFEPGKTLRRRNTERYLTYKGMHKAGRMHGDFDTSSIIDMRQTLIIGGRFSTRHDVTYLSKERNHKRGSYAGACWAVPYRKYNTFGNSIHGRDYYWPWAHQWPSAKTYDVIGGVCSSLSTYEAKATQIHGIPSTTAGQPGHCAYVLKHVPNKWRVSNSVSNPTRPHTYWRGHYDYLALKEAIFSDMASVRRAWQYVWLSKAISPNTISKDEKIPMSSITLALYTEALKHSPLQLGIWYSFADALKLSETDEKRWQDLGKQITDNFNNHTIAAWDLIHKYVTPSIEERGDDTFVKTLISYHKTLLQSEPVSTHLGWIKDVNRRFEFFKELIKIYEGHRNFWTVYNAGKGFGRNKQTADAYTEFLAELYKRKGKDGSSKLLTGLNEMILEFEKKKNFDQFQHVSKIGKNIISRDDSIKHVNLSTKTLASYPELPKMPGTLLSESSILQLSRSDGTHDRPIFHHAALSGDKLGYLCTAQDYKPSATVIFPNKVQLQGISIVTRYEYKKGSPVPLTLKISENGKKWETIKTFTTYQAVLSFTFSATEPDAKYVRIESDFGTNKKRLQLRGILIYGKAYY